MNIIKLKDIIMPDKHSIAEVFNKILRGQYAYWVQMRYIVPFPVMSHAQYVDCEQNESKIKNFPHIDMYSSECCMINFVETYVDSEETDKINSISKYILHNEHTPDEGITVSELKLFRRWLASTILSLNSSMDDLDQSLKLNDIQTHVLSYYANDMYNDVVKYLSVLGVDINMANNETSCGCCSNESLNIMTNPISLCNSLSTYQSNIHKEMVKMFSDINFWMKWSPEFLSLFKKYIDNILKVGLKVSNNTISLITLKDCTCNKEEIDNSTNILNRLSIALGYMVNGEQNSHKNYIYDALYEWSSGLYEYMQW